MEKSGKSSWQKLCFGLVRQIKKIEIIYYLNFLTLKHQVYLSSIVTGTHCSYLDIYISQKISLCNGDFEGKFQTNTQASIMNFLIWKWKFIILIFLLFLAGVVKYTAFCTLLLLFQWLDVCKLQFDAKMWLEHFNLLEIAVTVCKKQWIWQLLPKIEGKWV